jgi:hypothetical protein
VSIPLSFIALSLDEISDAWMEGKRRWGMWRRKRREGRIGGGVGEGDGRDGGAAAGLDVLRVQRAISMARSQRKSLDPAEWVEAGMVENRRSLRLSRETVGTAGTAGRRGGREREKVTGFRMRASGDVERGFVVR